MKLAASSDIEKAVDVCFECFKPLMTHSDIVFATKVADKSKYKKQYSLCEDCISLHADIYEVSQ